jgi:hypothetical protein
LVTNETGAVQMGSISYALFLMCGGNNELGALTFLGVGREGKCGKQGERQQ